ncbi:MAG TPA: methylmalonyl Co-A mutase-associated GTPase MeaB [Candidatus Angelobacter sp.]|nr:methylmalonyl Co-A mutase-associated GTPase MeaB [Candidatus Angelobacter sp.]
MTKRAPAKPKHEDLAESVIAGDRRALARAITLIESTRVDHRAEAAALLDKLLPAAGKSIRLGISGAPGVGKSSFIEAFGLHVIGQGHRVAVLAVDPSSKIGGGSILGDKTRMAGLATAEGAFIRPSPAGGTLGGVARRTRESITAVEAAGFDVVVVETVGVGQSETAVADMVDMFVLMLQPAGGDDLQGLKRGIVELADLILVNKSDGELAAAAGRTAADYQHALHLLRAPTPGWTPEVRQCSALTGAGVGEVWQTVARFRQALSAGGYLQRRRSEQARAALHAELSESLLAALRSDPDVARRLADLEKRVAGGRLSPAAAADAVVAAFLNQSATDRSK